MADSKIPYVNRPSVALPALVLAGIIGFFGFHGTGGEWLDFQVQSWFWNGSDWLIPKDAGWFHSLAYDGPKVGLILFAVGLLWAIALPCALTVLAGTPPCGIPFRLDGGNRPHLHAVA